MKRIAITPGEPAGIGPDIVLTLALQPALPAVPIMIADPDLLSSRIALLRLPLRVCEITTHTLPENQEAETVFVLPVALRCPSTPGKADSRNAAYVLKTLQTAVSICLEGHCQAMVTGPVHKGIINDAGIPFTGHTEYLANLTQTTPVMMLAADNFRVALVTTHLPLAEVSHAITDERLEAVITIVHHELITRFGIQQPRIKIAGLNPHAGESGYLGREEIEIMLPVIERLRHQGLDLSDPLPADTLFTQQHLRHCDAVLAMYHDQGLPVLKYASFGRAVNITLGLPMIRVSVDHGTAFELAGTGNAQASSLIQAFRCAATFAQR